MQGTQMFGYWSPHCPVKTDNPAVLATSYVKTGKVLVSLASWAPDTAQCSLSVNWSSLGLDTAKVMIDAPFVKNFQEARTFKVGERIPVAPGKGWLLEIQSK